MLRGKAHDPGAAPVRVGDRVQRRGGSHDDEGGGHRRRHRADDDGRHGDVRPRLRGQDQARGDGARHVPEAVGPRAGRDAEEEAHRRGEARQARQTQRQDAQGVPPVARDPRGGRRRRRGRGAAGGGGEEEEEEGGHSRGGGVIAKDREEKEEEGQGRGGRRRDAKEREEEEEERQGQGKKFGEEEEEEGQGRRWGGRLVPPLRLRMCFPPNGMCTWNSP
mmetsp:Transcript_20346/g.48471  ORF Transcript_20346/g.48471 Transcript_20346/m.48471 type:complete len:220 (+) Transcript_20346:1125-1784(+)